MLKLNRRRSNRSGEKLEFRFSNLQAFKVPVGWDKLFLSIISVETGKTIAKSSKATVRGGTCQWSTGLESIWISHDDASKELEESQFKFVLSMGSSRSSILGEIILNFADYLSSEDSDPLLLPMKKCELETTLQIKIQCVNPKENSSAAIGWQHKTSHPEGLNTNNQRINSKFDASDGKLSKGMESLSINNLNGASCPDECGKRDTSFLASSSHFYADSGNDYSSSGRRIISPRKHSNGGQYIGRHDSSSYHSSATIIAGTEGELSRSNRSSFNSGTSGSSIHMNQRQDVVVPTSEDGLPLLSLRSHSSITDIEISEEIEDLHDEVKMWERHSRQLKLDIEALKKEISDKSKSQTNLDRELADAYKEHDCLKQEVKQLKVALKESMSKDSKQTNSVILESQGVIFAPKEEDIINMKKELEDELKNLKESNANLTLQLRKNQESNVEFVSIIQELEQTIEKQRLEIDNLTKKNHMTEKLIDNEAEMGRKLIQKEEMFDLEGNISNVPSSQQLIHIEVNRGYSDLQREIEILNLKVQELEKKCIELTDENLNLTSEMKESSKDIGDKNFTHGPRSNGAQGLILKRELELHLTDLRQENVQLSEHISGLETQLRYMTNAKESIQQELENSTSLLSDLKDKIKENQAETEIQRIEANKKFQESQKQLTEAQEESGILRMSNSELQATIDSFVEECSSLHNLTGVLKRQKQEMHKHVKHLEFKLDESQKIFFGFCKKVELLVAKLPLQQRDLTCEEFLSLLENLFQEDHIYKEKIIQAHGKLKKMESDKISNVENLQEDVAHLTEQLPSNPVELENMASIEGSYANEAELKNELSYIHKENSEYQRRLQALEEEKEYFMSKSHLVEELMLKEEPHVVNEKLHEMGTLYVGEVDQESNTQQLVEFAKASMTHNMHEIQVKRSSTEKKIHDPEDLDGKISENNTMSSDNASRMSFLEAELKDMKERYLHMSLQYAQVEAQREELVLKLKSMQKEKR